MSKFTLYRADVDSPRLARVLGKVPGIAVGGEREADEVPADEETEPTATDEGDDDGGLREKVPIPDTDIGDGEKRSVVKRYGLLGLGVSMVMLGVATVGIWVYRRRNSDGESETPPPATGLDSGGPTPSTDETELSTSGTESTPSTGETEPSPSIVRPDERDEPAQEPKGRTEGDRSDVEWEPRDTAPAGEAETTDESAVDDSTGPETDDEPRPTESVDAAPLLGAAFLAVSGAVVKWLQSGDER
ncbi:MULTISPECIES: hypothetical protein [Haloarcula]|uniref:hypothetical protein n=1 Tax=Haloarcula TaxID=2237 RepID=UPI0023E81D6B|nr:hypothetical protein [Halomicroarcula sp. SHR3]